MKIFKIWLSILIFSSFALSALDLDKKKDLDQPGAFRLSFLEVIPSGASIPFPKADTIPRRGYEPIPYVGVYANPLYLSTPHVMIQMPPEHLLSKAPEKVQKLLKEHKIEAFIFLSGRACRFNPKTNKKEYCASDIRNIFLHMWAFENYAPAASIPMGLFKPVAISSVDMPIGRLAPIAVNLHPDGNDKYMAAWSPNNAKIRLLSTSSYHAGWIVAIHGKRALLVYQGIFNGELGEEVLETLAVQAKTTRELLDGIPSLLAVSIPDEEGQKEQSKFLMSLFSN